jgi:hypothetical protein
MQADGTGAEIGITTSSFKPLLVKFFFFCSDPEITARVFDLSIPSG